LHLLVHAYGADRVRTVSFDFGQRHDIELDMACKSVERLGVSHEIITLDYLHHISRETSSLVKNASTKPKTYEENAGDPQIDTYVPFRNLQFAAIEAAYAEANGCSHIFQGLNCVDIYGYWDTSMAFVDVVNAVLRLNRHHAIEFFAPFVDLYKEDELVLARELSDVFEFDVLTHTWSCYNGKNDTGKECGLVGKCNTCIEKLTGYVKAGYSNEEIMAKFQVGSEKALETFRQEMEG
jgi:7-cyano-7-deazaguanine synthase